jgi:hypothetical protein
MAAEFYAILSVAVGILVPLAQNLDICAMRVNGRS